MSRPNEYDNLIRSKAFESVAPTTGAVTAYEGYFQVVQAVLEFYEVRTKDAGRNLAIQRVSSDLKVDAKEFAFITRAHERRNGTSYSSPFPPVSKAEARTMVAILEKYLPQAKNLTGNVPDN